MTVPNQQVFPNTAVPFVDGNGKLTPAWLRFLISLWNRTGGSQPFDPIYVPATWIPQQVPSGLEILVHAFVESGVFAANFGGAQGGCRIAPSADFVVTVSQALAAKPNAFKTQIGTITISAGTTVASFKTTGAAQVSIAAGDRIMLKAPAASDGALQGFYASMFAQRTS